MTKKLFEALHSVDWRKNIDQFLSANECVAKIDDACNRIAVMSFQIETVEKDNPAICFIREMQISAQHSALLLALGLYRPAAASMRNLVESALYYTFFRIHPAELQTLARIPSYYVDKRLIIAFHQEHTDQFTKRQSKLGLLSLLDAWYSDTSAIVHGQMPGKWLSYTSIKNISLDEEILEEASSMLENGELLIRKLFLCTIFQDIWYGIAKGAKKTILSGLPGDQKVVLGLDAA